MHADVAEIAAEVREPQAFSLFIWHQHELVDQVRDPDIQRHGAGQAHIGQYRPQMPTGGEAGAKKQQLIYRNDQIALVCVKAEHTCPDTPSGNQLRMQQQPGGIEKKEKKC